MIRCVVFDLDGTLVTSELDFAAIKRDIGMGSEPILEYMARVDDAERARAAAILDRHERRAAAVCDLAEGVRALLAFLGRKGIRTAVLTRNSRVSVQTVLERFGLEFDAIVAREDAAPKPSPEPVFAIARALDIPPEQMLVVGDYVFDIDSGRSAGARTALVRLPERANMECTPDHEVTNLADLIPLVQQLVEGEAAVPGD